jgi:hypothetical protein
MVNKRCCYNNGRNASRGGKKEWDAPGAGMSPVSSVIVDLGTLFLVYIGKPGVIETICLAVSPMMPKRFMFLGDPNLKIR